MVTELLLASRSEGESVLQRENYFASAIGVALLDLLKQAQREILPQVIGMRSFLP